MDILKKEKRNDDYLDRDEIEAMQPTSRFDDLQNKEEFDDETVVVDEDSKTIDSIKQKKSIFEEVCNKKIDKLSKKGAKKYFRLPIPELGFEVSPADLNPETLLKTHFPWFPFSKEFYEEMSISACVMCYEKKNVDITICEGLQAALLADFQEDVRKIDDVSSETILRKHIKMLDEIENERKVYYTDPTTLLFRKMHHVEESIQKIYKDHQTLYTLYMNRMRRVSLKLLCKTLDKNDAHLPTPLTATIEYLEKSKNKSIYIEQNISCFDISCYSNAVIRMLLYYELDEVSSNHAHVLQLFISSLAVHFYRFRTDCPMKMNLMYHGQPGTGKSVITAKLVTYSIDGTIEDIVSKSEKAIVNPRAGKYNNF